MSHLGVPKAVLYYDPVSVWSRAALLTLEEKGYGKDEVDLRVVDRTKAEEFSPALLRLNPKATLPILVVPLQGTLGADVETRFMVIADPKALLDFLDKSRSSASRSHSTSTAPAPSLSPATVGFIITSNKIIDIVHSDAVAPETLHHFNPRDPRSLQNLAATLVPILQSRKEVLTAHIADCDREVIKMSDRTKALWNNTKHEIERLLKYYGGQQAEEYFSVAKQTWEQAVPDALVKVNEEIVGPYILGKIAITCKKLECNLLRRRPDLGRRYSSMRLVGGCRESFRRELQRLGGCCFDESGTAHWANIAQGREFTMQAGGILGFHEEAIELGQHFYVTVSNAKRQSCSTDNAQRTWICVIHRTYSTLGHWFM
ncbi:hypothetical protein JVU11DRAFT_5130 [Chiua virens]|nr:hypothetical protein JVU11DRAFT_5130 [Chiua virens]